MGMLTDSVVAEHEVYQSCTILHVVHGIVPEVYYLHEVCHSCTNLVHGIVPEVYYLHEVCHLCTNLVHGIVLQLQWSFIPYCSTDRRAKSKKEAV